MTGPTMTELHRTRWIGRSRGHNAAGRWVIGPVLVDVITLDAGPQYHRIFVLEIDGRHQFGGPASHLGSDGLPRAPFLDLEPDPIRTRVRRQRLEELARRAADRAGVVGATWPPGNGDASGPLFDPITGQRCAVCGGLNPGDVTHTRCQ
jgi:hypothetical protein